VDALLLLRILTVAARLGLAAALLTLVIRHGRSLAHPARSCWTLVALAAALLALDNLVLEIVAAALAERGTALDTQVRYLLYHATYVAHAFMGVLVPLGALALFGGAGRLRRGAVAAMLTGAAVTAIAAGTGALTDWSQLLVHTRLLSFLTVAAYLVFWAAVALGYLARVDAYLAGYLAVDTVFELLLPVQGVFFQLAGREAAASLWHLLQFLQFATALAQLVIVLALLYALAQGRGLPPVAVPTRE
jgi:hypothetical protein